MGSIYNKLELFCGKDLFTFIEKPIRKWIFCLKLKSVCNGGGRFTKHPFTDSICCQYHFKLIHEYTHAKKEDLADVVVYIKVMYSFVQWNYYYLPLRGKSNHKLLENSFKAINFVTTNWSATFNTVYCAYCSLVTVTKRWHKNVACIIYGNLIQPYTRSVARLAI